MRVSVEAAVVGIGVGEGGAAEALGCDIAAGGLGDGVSVAIEASEVSGLDSVGATAVAVSRVRQRPSLEAPTPIMTISMSNMLGTIQRHPRNGADFNGLPVTVQKRTPAG